MKSLTDLFLVRSEITCHIIVSCQKNCPQKIYQNATYYASTCKERNQLINTKLRIRQLSYSCASGCGTALRIKACHVVSMFWKSFNFWPGPSCRITGKLDLFYIICNGAVWCSISIISARARLDSAARAHYAAYCHVTSPVTVGRHWQPVSDSESARLPQPECLLVGRLVLSLTASCCNY